MQLQTDVGKKLLEALQNYGGYVVDDTASLYNTDAAIVTEPHVEEELREHYNVSLAYPHGLPGTDEQPLFDDLVRIFQSLHAVANNGPGSIGGGGEPRVPIAPPMCEL